MRELSESTVDINRPSAREATHAKEQRLAALAACNNLPPDDPGSRRDYPEEHHVQDQRLQFVQYRAYRTDSSSSPPALSDAGEDTEDSYMRSPLSKASSLPVMDNLDLCEEIDVVGLDGLEAEIEVVFHSNIDEEVDVIGLGGDETDQEGLATDDKKDMMSFSGKYLLSPAPAEKEVIVSGLLVFDSATMQRAKYQPSSRHAPRVHAPTGGSTASLEY
ncbi:hypothetical protein FS749_004288 [Ceratobasidium sp. UAMH 11750]|nr:hypothetical protein FS749_004288 [Ceratobasidium sp. UAMH 11750]